MSARKIPYYEMVFFWAITVPIRPRWEVI